MDTEPRTTEKICCLTITEQYHCNPLRLKPTLEAVMAKLRDSNINMIGLHGKDNNETWNVIENASRRVRRDNLYDEVVVADLTNQKSPEKIQEEIARALDLRLRDGTIYRWRFFLNGKSIIAERAGQICERIKTKRRVLIILHNLFWAFNMKQVGIPFGDGHGGCKILVASTNQQVLKDAMESRLIFSIEDIASF